MKMTRWCVQEAREYLNTLDDKKTDIEEILVNAAYDNQWSVVNSMRDFVNIIHGYELIYCTCLSFYSLSCDFRPTCNLYSGSPDTPRSTVSTWGVSHEIKYISSFSCIPKLAKAQTKSMVAKDSASSRRTCVQI